MPRRPAEIALAKAVYGTSNKGKVMRADDRRLRPHSPEHMANIRAGIARSQWSHRQSQLVQADQPHERVPMTPGAAKAFGHRALKRMDRDAIPGECHWCYFWEKEGLTHVG